MKNYWNASEGRLFLFAIGILLSMGGIGALLGTTAAGIAVTCFGALAAVVCTVFSAGLGGKEHPRMTIYICSIMPNVLFLFILGQGLAMREAPAWGYGFIALGLLAISRAAFGPRSVTVAAAQEAHA